MKTVTVGADTPVTSISPRPAVARGPVQPSHTGSAEAAAPSGISVPPPAAKRANASAPTSMLGQSLSSSLRRRADSANPERPSVAPGSANSCKGGRPGGREEADTKKKGCLELSGFARSKLGACALAWAQKRAAASSAYAQRLAHGVAHHSLSACPRSVLLRKLGSKVAKPGVITREYQRTAASRQPQPRKVENQHAHASPTHFGAATRYDPSRGP